MLYWNQPTIKRAIGSAIWNTSEFFKIPLGRFAPIVFGWMIAAKRRNIKVNQTAKAFRNLDKACANSVKACQELGKAFEKL